MALYLAVLGLVVLTFCVGIVVGHQAARVPRPAPPLNRVQLTDDFCEFIHKVERRLQQHGRAMAEDVTALAAAVHSASCSEVIGRMIERQRAASEEIQQFANTARGHRHEAVRTAVEEELAIRPEAKSDSEFPGDRRKEQRHPYWCKQWIAPYSGSRLPVAHEFVLVQCRDLSSGGISFFVDELPDQELLIVRLHGVHGTKYLTARIQQTTPSGNLEHGRYVIGCQFIGTLHASAMPADVEAVLSDRLELAMT